MADNVKRTYEGLFLVDPGWASNDWEEVVAAVNTLMDRAGAELLNLRKWDERRLCYEIEGRKRGMYILTYFDADPESIAGMERDVKLHELILRALILRADDIPEAIRELPTPVMAAEQAAEKAAEKAAERAAEKAEASQSDSVAAGADATAVAEADVDATDEKPVSDISKDNAGDESSDDDAVSNVDDKEEAADDDAEDKPDAE